MMDAPLAADRARLMAQFEFALDAHVATLTHWPDRLVAACRHVLFGGGKRVRPLLALLAAEAVGASAEVALPWAMAVECVHTYSLVHDDLPAMDDDDERRGRPTCHVAFDEATAILAGDALLTEAFRLLAVQPGGAPIGPLVALLGEASGGGGMIGGQVDDIRGGLDSFDALMAMQAGKTGALIRAAALGGALAAGAEPAVADGLATYGAALGVLFQITDDILDADQDAERDGNSVLHHLDTAAVIALRDRYAAEASAALAPLGAAAESLHALARYVTHRSV